MKCFINQKLYRATVVCSDCRATPSPLDSLSGNQIGGWGRGGATTEKEVTVEPRPMQGGDGGAAASSGGGLMGVVPGGELGLGAATTRSFRSRRFQGVTVDRRWGGDAVGALSQLRVTRGW
jgi:hypothetical protein